MGTCLLLLPMRPPSLPLWLGSLVAAASIAAETLVVHLLAGGEARRGAAARDESAVGR